MESQSALAMVSANAQDREPPNCCISTYTYTYTCTNPLILILIRVQIHLYLYLYLYISTYVYVWGLRGWIDPVDSNADPC